MYQIAVLTVSQLTSTTHSQTVLLLTTLDLSSTSARSQMSLIHLVIVMAFYDLVMVALYNRADRYIFILWVSSSSSFFFFLA